MFTATRPTRRQQPARNGKAPEPAITLSEAEGVRYLHFGTEWVQGAMRLARPFSLELEYQQQMMAAGLLVPDPQRIVLLGLGAAALAKFCWKSCAPAQVTVVELAPAVVEVARRWFRLPADNERLTVVVDDARTFVSHPLQRDSADWLLVDLYDSAARGPVYDDAGFYAACCACLRLPGVAAFNLFGRRFEPSFEAIATAFGNRVLVLPRTDAGNRIVLAYRGSAFEHARRSMALHVEELQARWRLPMNAWAAGARTNGLAPND